MWPRYAPTAELPPEYVVPDPSWKGLRSNGIPSVLSYGFAFTLERLIQYGVLAKLIKTPKPSRARVSILLQCICDHIQHLSGTSSRPVLRDAIHDKYDVILALWDNYTVVKGAEVRKRDKDIILNTMRRELQIPDDEQPMWYFDGEKLDGPFA